MRIKYREKSMNVIAIIKTNATTRDVKTYQNFT